MKAIPMAAQAALAKFESARETLHAFQKQNARVVKDYDMLRQAYNESRDNVKQLYKEHFSSIGERFGDFTAKPTFVVDIDQLKTLLGASVDSVIHVEYKLVTKEYNEAIKCGIIPQGVVKQVEIPGIPKVWAPKVA